MTTQHSLLKAIRESPFDENLRLVYADWLEENGDPDQAEMIRLQCEMESLDFTTAKWNVLRERTEALFREHHAAWTGLEYDSYEESYVEYDRGTLSLNFSDLFLGDVEWKAWKKSVGERLAYLDAEAIEEEELFEALDADGWLEGVTTLRVPYVILDEEIVDILASLTELRSLEVDGRWLDAENLAKLAALPNLQRLKVDELIPESWDSRNSKRKKVAPISGCKDLRSLELICCQLIPFHRLVDFSTLGKLKELDFELNGAEKDAVPWKKLSTLERLELTTRQVPGKWIATLAELPNLRNFTWHDLRPGNGTLQYFRELKQLKQLTLRTTSTRRLEKLQVGPALEHLAFRCNEAGSLQSLPEIPNLRGLYVPWNHITPSDVPHLKKFPELRTLVLTGTKVSGASMKHLATLEHLEDLALEHTPVGDNALQHFVNMRSLKYLGLHGARKFSNEALAQLRKERPDVMVAMK